MTPSPNAILEQVKKLKTAQVQGKRAPHKPLLLLLALGQYQQGKKLVKFQQIEGPLRSLLLAFAPPTKSMPQPELPYWYLQSDSIWIIPGADRLERKSSGFPSMKALRLTSGSFTPDIQYWLDTDPTALAAMAGEILQQHFLPSTWQDLLDQCELQVPLPFELTSPNEIKEGSNAQQRYRSPQFRRDVLKAYDYRCAVTGFQISVGGTVIGCEAAHVQAHAFDGPDSVDNGLALEPTLHLLFDRGIWTLSDDRRVLVSEQFTGSDTGIDRIRSLSGKTIRDPLPGQPSVKTEHIRWHREANLGGVFRGPALPW